MTSTLDASGAPGRRSGVRWLAFGALIAVALSLVSCVGCATVIVPPHHVSEPAAVYLADYGRHASLVMPHDDETLVEYTYGEWQWYALNQKGVFGAIRSLLLPSQGALGRRYIDDPPGQVWWEDLGLLNLYEIEVDRGAVRELLSRLDQRWAGGDETRLLNPLYGIEFVYDPQIYMFFNNSNPTTARWLRELGCEVRGPALMSNWRISQ